MMPLKKKEGMTMQILSARECYLEIGIQDFEVEYLVGWELFLDLMKGRLEQMT